MNENTTDEEIIADAMAKNPGCEYGMVDIGMNGCFQLTRIVHLWRNLECYLADDPPRATVEGYPRYPRLTPFPSESAR